MFKPLLVLPLLTLPALAGEVEDEWNRVVGMVREVPTHTYEEKCADTYCTYTLSAALEGQKYQMIRTTHRDGTEELVICRESECAVVKERAR
jgi:hypothetical protein